MKSHLTWILLLIATFGYGQSINTTFGKNRVQYHDDFDKWWQYESDNFITYWYGKGRKIAESTIQIAEKVHDEIQNIMEYRTNDKLMILVYTDITDLKQSNIGLEEIFTSSAERTKVVGNKIFVHFNGNHRDLETQIRQGIASVYMDAMLFGNNFQEIVQNAVLLDIPKWYREGIVAYCGQYWSAEADDELRDLLYKNPKNYDFKCISENYPRIAGHSMWYYIDRNYGKSAISNILYLTRISHDFDDALLYTINVDLDDLQSEWKRYYKSHYLYEKDLFSAPEKDQEVHLRNKKEVPVSQLKLNNDGSKLLYVCNNIGKYQVVLRDMETSKEKVVFRHGHKNKVQATDYNYPILCWSPDQSQFTIIYEHRDVLYLRQYDSRTLDYREQVIPEDFQRIWSVSQTTSEDYIFAANTNGFSDIYRYNTTSRQHTPITNDFYDDLDVEVITIDRKKYLLFASNRTVDHIFEMEYDTIIPTGNFDIFLYDLESGTRSVTRLTDTPDWSERYPYYSAGKITYLANINGIQNKYILDLNAKTSVPVTNLDRNIIRHHSCANGQRGLFTLYRNGAYETYFTLDKPTGISHLPLTEFYAKAEQLKQEKTNPSPLIIKENEPQYIPEDLLFQSPYGSIEKIAPLPVEIKNKSTSVATGISLDPETPRGGHKVEKFNNARAYASRLLFRLDNFSTKLDNEVLFEGLESYTGDRDQLLNTPVGLLFKGTFKDLFEDYTIIGGARFPFSFNGSEYFLSMENRKRLIDHKLTLYRKSQTSVIQTEQFPLHKARKTSLLGLYQWKYPFDIYRSIRATMGLRFDRYFLLSVDEPSFSSPVTTEKRINAKLEYVYDNTMHFASNVLHGTRYKIYLEGINEFNFDLVDGIDIDLSKGFTGVFGFDARHYIPLLKYSVIALRVAGATSFGTKKNLYYLGGVNNSITGGFNTTINIPQGNFAYKTNVYHLRGFSSNVRNGGSYALANAEIRVPVFRYFMGNFGGSNILRNFQFVFFYDIGSAWHGLSPYSDDNPLNTVKISSPPVLNITVKYQRDPFVMGYGVGARVKLFGYMLRLDYARGVETGIIQKPKLHLSLGMDF